MRMKSLFDTLKSPRVYVVASAFFMASLFSLEYAFAQEELNSTPEQEASSISNTPSTTNTLSPSQDTKTAPTSVEMLSDVEELSSRVAAMDEEKSQLNNAWLMSRNKYDSIKSRIDDSKKIVRLEMDDVLLNGTSRERLDDLLSQHQSLSKDEKEAAQSVTEFRDKLAAHQLLLVQAKRDLQSLRSMYASQKREEDIQHAQEITGLLDRKLHFNEQVSFKCSTSKSLSTCLTDYLVDSRTQNWVQKHYHAALADALAGKVDPIELNSGWYTAKVDLNYTQASMMLDGTVEAGIEVSAHVTSRKMMACALLKVPTELCEAKLASLIVRSNKYGDEVYINNKHYGSTPLSVMLDPGVYSIEVKYQGKTQERTLTLDKNRHTNFIF